MKKLLATLIAGLALSFGAMAEDAKKPEGAAATVAPAQKKVEMPKNIHRPEKKEKKEDKKEEAKK